MVAVPVMQVVCVPQLLFGGDGLDPTFAARGERCFADHRDFAVAVRARWSMSLLSWACEFNRCRGVDDSRDPICSSLRTRVGVGDNFGIEFQQLPFIDDGAAHDGDELTTRAFSQGNCCVAL